MGNGWHDFTTLPPVDTSKVRTAAIPPWQDAIENFLIGYGMGWELEGFLQTLVDVLPDDSPCKSLKFVVDENKT